MKLSVIVLAYGDEPQLEDCVAAVLDSRDIDVQLVLVDNGCSRPEAVAAAESRHGVTVLRPGNNLGYAGGCDLGAASSDGEVLAFVNSDAIVAPEALARLASVAGAEDVGLATASVRLAETPEVLNTAGNPWHLCGVVWAGHYGEPALRHAVAGDVATASGAAFAVRRTVWEALGGFDETWFAYNEDAELSLRAWQRGWRVVYVPDAVVLHHYEFSRNPRKSYLLERNRLLNVLSLYETRTLALLAPVLALFELGVLVVALRQGWLRQKLDSYRWIYRHRDWLRARRREVQVARRRPDRELAHLFTARFDPANVEAPAGTAVINFVVGNYWRLVRRFV